MTPAVGRRTVSSPQSQCCLPVENLERRASLSRASETACRRLPQGRAPRGIACGPLLALNLFSTGA